MAATQPCNTATQRCNAATPAEIKTKSIREERLAERVTLLKAFRCGPAYHMCTGAGPTPAGSVHFWAHPCHICTGTGAHPCDSCNGAELSRVTTGVRARRLLDVQENNALGKEE
jgi:hypothetical protein